MEKVAQEFGVVEFFDGMLKILGEEKKAAIILSMFFMEVSGMQTQLLLGC